MFESDQFFFLLFSCCCCQWIKQPLSRCNAAIKRTSKWMVFIQLVMWCYSNVIRKFFTIPFALPIRPAIELIRWTDEAEKNRSNFNCHSVNVFNYISQAKLNHLTSIRCFCRSHFATVHVFWSRLWLAYSKHIQLFALKSCWIWCTHPSSAYLNMLLYS